MRYGHWIVVRAKRLFVVLLSLVIYTFLLILDGMRFFPREMQHHVLTRFSWLEYGFPSFVALMYLGIGVLIWLYVSDRGIARLLFTYSSAATLTFAVQAGAVLNDPLLSTIGDIGASLTLFLFAVLLLFFPARIYARKPPPEEQSTNANASVSSASSRSRLALLIPLRIYIGLLAVLCVVGFIGDIVVNEFSGAVSPDFLRFLVFFHNLYALLALTGIIATIIVSYRSTPTLRERQQRRIFVGGVILATAPLLLLTVIPALLSQAFGLSPRYIINPQLSTMTVGLFPLALGYSILRYQFLVFDMYIQRAVSWLIGCVGLLMGCYAVITLSSVLFSQNASTYAIFMVFLIAMVAPLIWWLGKVITASAFFSEMAHYQRMINRADVLTDEKVDLDEAARLLTLASVNTFGTQEVCLFVLDEETGYFALTPQEMEGVYNTVRRQRLLERLTQAVQQPHHASPDRIHNDDPIIGRLDSAKRPLFMREVLARKNELPTGLGRYLMSGDDLDSTDPLLVPVKYQGTLIGILVLGQRADQQHYAGPDFEAMYLLVARFASVIETARLYVHASRHVAVLDALYSADTKSFQAFETVEDAAKFYAQIAADATQAGAEILLYNVYGGHDQKEGQLDHITHTGNGPRLIPTDRLKLTGEGDWSAWFYQGSSSSPWHGPSNEVPACLSQTPCYPFAWIPLLKGEKRIGVLVLTYARPHIFSQEEQRVMSIFASQCVAGLENVRIAIELRAAYERQKELDHLKDQFIMTASHELRTPLTAVQGYIELLNDYDASLSPQARADFIAKAHRGCDELALMVGNIMDASRVQVDVENTRLDTVSLLDAVKHVLEILEAIARREKRTIQVDIPDTIYVLADSLRLRQILLNIISNAFKYSPAGTNIEIRAELEANGMGMVGMVGMADMVTVSIRDHGSGVPLQFKDRLFERFVRLERDMNSPIRGVGLGLAICKQLVEAMGGKIRVESTGVPGEGSTFIFTLKQGTLEEEMNLLARARQGA